MDMNDLVIEAALTNYIRRAYAVYSLEANSARGLSSAADGLKPVIRRVCYQMYLDKLTPTSKKFVSAKVASSTAGNFHPHNSESIYESAAKIAAPWIRVPLIDGGGFFGKVYGDEAGASRYTYMRMSPEGWSMVSEIGDHTVRMVPSFNPTYDQPLYLPVPFPNLLINGDWGLGVGWAAKIPQHNPAEILALCRALLKNPSLPDEKITEIVPAPDWATGGEVDPTSVAEYQRTGRGIIKVRGKAQIEGRSIYITELPYGVNPETFRDKLKEKVIKGEVEGITDIKDLTDKKTDLSIEIIVKKGFSPTSVLAAIRANTVFETTFGANMVALDDDMTPRVWSMRDLILSFLDLRRDVVLRSHSHRVKVSVEKKHLLDGLAVILLDIDKAVSIIRSSETVAAARKGLMDHFSIDTLQADNVLSMQLRRLTSQDSHQITAEIATLESVIDQCEKVLRDPAEQDKIIVKGLKDTEKMLAPRSERKTAIVPFDDPNALISTPATGKALKDGEWGLDSSGVLASQGTPLDAGIAWAVTKDGKIKVFGGGGLPKKVAPTPIVPSLESVLSSGVATPGSDLLVLTSQGKALRVNLEGINPQGIAGTGVKGIILPEGVDLVYAGTITDEMSVLTIADSSWKVTQVSDIPRKGTGGQGVFVHVLKKSESAITEAAVGSGFTVNGKAAKAVTRAKVSTASPVSSWEITS